MERSQQGQEASQTEAKKAKQVKISLAWYTHQYKVVSITNTTAFKPGDWLAIEQVERLCQRDNFEVHIADNEIIAAITGVLSSAVSLGVKF